VVLNYIWISFFLIALVVAVIKTLNGDLEIFTIMVNGTFDNAKSAFEICLYLTGILCLWLGIMKIGEMGGAVNAMSRLVGPFFNRLFPDVPANHPARGSMLMNFSANMLGLDNAATPVGLKAMNELQELNPNKDTASNAQIMFLVLNTSGLTIIPVSIMAYREAYGAANPADVFLPILIATFFSTLVGLIVVALYQRINLLNSVVLAYLGTAIAVIAAMMWYFSSLDDKALQEQSSFFSSVILYGLICTFIVMAVRKKVNVYEAFIEGAKDGFSIAIKIVPFLVAMIVAIGLFRASGAMDYLLTGFEWFFSLFFSNVDFVHGLPTALMKPLSGGGARAMMLESFETHGVDSFIGRLNAVQQGACDTTFYIIAVYFGSVGIRRVRYAIKAGLLADLAGVVTAIIVSYIWFGDSSSTHLKPKETVIAFTGAWSENKPSVSAQYLHEDCYIYDEAYDTAYATKQSILNDLLIPDSVNHVNRSIVSVTETRVENMKIIYTKMKVTRDSLFSTEAYEYVAINGKIKAIRYLGIYN
jgi:spore maturation protein SpmA